MAYDEITSAITVSELNKALDNLVSEAFYQVVVVGEISGFKKRGNSGHWYFDLKDKDASISCVVWFGLQKLMPNFVDGDLVIAHGQISVYQKAGKLTFIISKIEMKGNGDLRALIEKRKAYYQSLGWFDEQIKKPIPEEIHKLGVVTSATGAAIQDILNITKRRAPSLDIILFPAVVQGNAAATTIASRIRQANNFDACDVLIVGRGGGSEEDLSCFSEDEVIVAIHESKIPIISAVGHEIDFPLSDYVADKRAPTPSAAAELVTETIFNRTKRLDTALMLTNAIMGQRLANAKSRIIRPDSLKSYITNKVLTAKSHIKETGEAKAIIERKIRSAEISIMHSQESCEILIQQRLKDSRDHLCSLRREESSLLKLRINESKSKTKELKREINFMIKERISIARSELMSTKKENEALSPLAILSRGYAIVTDKNGKAIKSKKKVNDGQELSIRVNDGSFDAVVKG